jgi:hypothetical protein
VCDRLEDLLDEVDHSSRERHAAFACVGLYGLLIVSERQPRACKLDRAVDYWPEERDWILNRLRDFLSRVEAIEPTAGAAALKWGRRETAAHPATASDASKENVSDILEAAEADVG